MSLKKLAFYSVSLLFSLAGNTHALWTSKPSGVITDLKAVFFIDTSTGWAAGASGRILKSVDEGETWTSQTSGTSNAIQDVHFANSSTGAAVGSDGAVLISTDGGTSWNSSDSGVAGFILYSVFWVNSSTAFAAGESGRIRRTSDGGATWVTGAPNGSTTSDLRSIFFINASTGWAVGTSGTILRTSDAGENWTDKISSGPTTNLRGVFFTNVSTGYVVGAGGTVYKSTDSGVSWLPLISSGVSFNSVHFFSTSSGRIVGTSGEIQKTSDSGETFTADRSSVTSDLTDVFILSNQLGFAVGDSGVILKLTNLSQVTPSVEIPQGELKAIDNLFDPSKGESTTLQYNLLKDGSAVIKIFSMQGRLIKTIFDGSVASNVTYTVTWDGKNEDGETVATGIYLAHIEGPGFSKTQKIAVIR